MTTKAKAPCISTGPTVGRMGPTTFPTAHYYTPLYAESQLVMLYRHALDREAYHMALVRKGGLHAALLAKHRAVRRFLETCLMVCIREAGTFRLSALMDATKNPDHTRARGAAD